MEKKMPDELAWEEQKSKLYHLVQSLHTNLDAAEQAKWTFGILGFALGVVFTVTVFYWAVP